MFPIDSPDTIIAEGQSRHEGQSRSPSVRPARRLRALHRHTFSCLVRGHAVPRSGYDIKRKKEREKRERKERRKREKIERETERTG